MIFFLMTCGLNETDAEHLVNMKIIPALAKSMKGHLENM